MRPQPVGATRHACVKLFYLWRCSRSRSHTTRSNAHSISSSLTILTILPSHEPGYMILDRITLVAPHPTIRTRSGSLPNHNETPGRTKILWIKNSDALSARHSGPCPSSMKISSSINVTGCFKAASFTISKNYSSCHVMLAKCMFW